jgi:hypothetical protein
VKRIEAIRLQRGQGRNVRRRRHGWVNANGTPATSWKRARTIGAKAAIKSLEPQGLQQVRRDDVGQARSTC